MRVAGVEYDLSHLHPLSFDFVVSAEQGKPEQRYPIDVVYSLHCFTRGIAPSENYTANLTYSDSRETRLFDVGRYNLSKLLPSIIRSIGSRRCFHTGHGNFFTVEFIDNDGRNVEYAVYFAFSRSRSKGRFTLFVQSAYDQGNIPRTRPKPHKPIRFSVIAFNVASGKPFRS